MELATLSPSGSHSVHRERSDAKSCAISLYFAIFIRMRCFPVVLKLPNIDEDDEDSDSDDSEKSQYSSHRIQDSLEKDEWWMKGYARLGLRGYDVHSCYTRWAETIVSLTEEMNYIMDPPFCLSMDLSSSPPKQEDENESLENPDREDDSEVAASITVSVYVWFSHGSWSSHLDEFDESQCSECIVSRVLARASGSNDVRKNPEIKEALSRRVKQLGINRCKRDDETILEFMSAHCKSILTLGHEFFYAKKLDKQEKEDM